MSQESYYWSEMAELTHVTQVILFGWCSCEDNQGNENPYLDCPKKMRDWNWTPRAKFIGMLFQAVAVVGIGWVLFVGTWFALGGN